MLSSIRAAALLAAVLVLVAAMTPLQAIRLAAGAKSNGPLPQIFWRLLCRIIGARITVVGTPSTRRPTVFVSNHVSWLDVPVQGAAIDASFIAKTEVAGWPLLGWLARLQRTVFIARKARRTAEERDGMAARLEAGDNLILYPEGTSDDGLRILPFKSAFFSLAERTLATGAEVIVQPVSLAYARLNGLPVGRRWMPIFAWVGDQNLLPHIWTFLKAGRVEVVMEFHPAVTMRQFASRKALSQWAWDVIAQGVSDAHAGRQSPRPAPPVLAA